MPSKRKTVHTRTPPPPPKRQVPCELVGGYPKMQISTHLPSGANPFFLFSWQGSDSFKLHQPKRTPFFSHGHWASEPSSTWLSQRPPSIAVKGLWWATAGWQAQIWVCGGQNPWGPHFGVGAPPSLVYFSGGLGCSVTGILTHGHVGLCSPVVLPQKSGGSLT